MLHYKHTYILFQPAVHNYSERREEKKGTKQNKTGLSIPGDRLGMERVIKAQFNLFYSKY